MSSYLTPGGHPDLTSAALSTAAGGGEDMIQVQTTHHTNNIATTEISMYQYYMPPSLATSAQQPLGTSSTTSNNTFNSALHNGLMEMRHTHQTPHELPYENHMLHQQLHDDDVHNMQQHQQYYTLTNDTNVSNHPLQQSMYNNSQNQIVGNISTPGAISQHTHLFDEVKGSSTWHNVGGIGSSGSSSSSHQQQQQQLPYIDHSGFVSQPLPPSQTQQHQHQVVTTGTQNNSHSNNINHNHFPQQQNIAYDYIHSSATTTTPAPTQAPLPPPPPPPLHQYRTQDAHLVGGVGGYHPSQQQPIPIPSGGAGHVPNFESNLRFATDHFAAALNFNAPYSEGGGGGGGLFGGLMMGGANASAGGVPNHPTGATAPPGVVPGEDEVRQQSVSSDSQAFYGNETMVKELRPEFVRWFYRYEHDRKWKPFTGYDSIRIESKYREVYRENIASYSHNSYYPVASSNDESTDFSKFVQLQHNLHLQQQNPPQPTHPQPSHQHPQPQHLHHHHVLPPNNNNNNTLNMTSMSNQSTPSRFSDMMQHKWWPGKGGETTVDTEFNNGGIGFPSSLRNNSIGATGYLPSAIKGRVGVVGGNNKEKMLQKANSASALLGNNGGNYANHPTGITPTAPVNPDMTKVIIVREGLYEVDLESWTCFSTYWPGDVCIITRGTWFYDGTWDPLPVDQAEKLEEGHMGKFCGASLINIQSVVGQTEEERKTGGTAAAPAIHRVSFNDFHVDWTSPTDIHWYSTAASHKFMRSVGQKLGFSDSRNRICRGYYKPACIVDRPSEIGHIVFVIHGIGHKMDTGRIVRNCSAFRDCVATMKDKYFPQLNNAKQRAEFFPVEWRSAAKLDGDIVEAITPQKLLTLRQLLNSTAMDIMYYTSPLYRAEIQNALRDELNRIYANFVKRNPSFTRNGGKVSVMAHSLGAVITYDIMTGYLCSMDGGSGMQHHIPQQGLLFNLEHFFCLGSPLSVFLALRWREPHDPMLRSQILPSHLCKRLYNVFYSSDPVAYRLEPLLSRYYVRIAPVTIHSYTAPGKQRYTDLPRELITKEMNVTKTASDNTATSLPLPLDPSTSLIAQKTTPTNRPKVPFTLKSMPSSPNKETNNWGGWFNITKYWKGSTSPAAPDGYSEGPVGELNPGNVEDASYIPNKENYTTVVDEEPLNIPNDLEYRLDYVLRESQFSGSSYIAALTSHTSYWSSPDTAYFVMTHLYDELIEQANDER